MQSARLPVYLLTPLLVMLVATAACESCRSATPTKIAASRLPLQPCRWEGVSGELLCGTLQVPENRQQPEKRAIGLRVVVVPALSGSPAPDPLFDLASSPGMGSTETVQLYATALADYRRKRDIVLVDQRGTGNSSPLHCDELEDPRRVLQQPMHPPAAVAACRRALEGQADLALHTTPIAAEDLDQVREWLGYERINLLGVDYGSRLALVYMRRYPERVRSAVLLAPSPTYKKSPLYHARDGQRALAQLLGQCEADADCHNAFPQLRQELQGLLQRGRLQVDYPHPRTGQTLKLDIAPEVLAEELRRLLYSPADSRQLPWLIHTASQGNFKPLLSLIVPDDLSGPSLIAEGAYLSVVCSEDTPLIDPNEIESVTKGMFGSYRVKQQLAACREWPKGELPPGYHEPVSSKAPTLVISGLLDPVSPPSWGEEIARHLAGARHLVVPHMAHQPDGLSEPACLDRVILDFLQRGSADGLDVSCLDRMLPPAFQLASEEPTAHGAAKNGP